MTVYDYLDLAHMYALKNSGCKKVAVGCVITQGSALVFGANRSIPDLCKSRKCLRVEKYGNDSKNHRNPEDCRAIHAEIDALTKCDNNAHQYTSKVYVTRYPCEACARALVSANVGTVYYGREQVISEETARIFDLNNIMVYHIKDWTAPDTER